MAVLLATGLAFMANYMAVKHRVRFDLSPGRYYALSAPTVNMLRHMEISVHAIVFLTAEHERFNDVKRLLKEYEYASPKFTVEYIDPHRELARAKELALTYNISGPDIIVFQANDRSKLVSAGELATYDYAPVLSGNPKEMTLFRGEQVVSSAVYSLIQEKKPLVYFLAGHGEHNISDFNQHSGFSMIARLIEKGNIHAKTLQFAENPSIPRDCDVLVIAGQKKPLTHVEAEIVKKYLDDSGRLLLMADNGVETGLEKILQAWNIRLGSERVVGATLTGRELLLSNFGNHPITEQLKNMTTILNSPRPIHLLPGSRPADQSADKPNVVTLAATSDEGWLEMSPNQAPPRFDAGVDRRGPIPVAVAVEKGNLPADVEIRPTRLVVTGDSTFICNGALLAGYTPDFFINALNWLLERKDAPTFAPKPPSRLRLNINRKQMQMIYILAVLIIPASIALIGLIVSLGRRK